MAFENISLVNNIGMSEGLTIIWYPILPDDVSLHGSSSLAIRGAYVTNGNIGLADGREWPGWFQQAVGSAIPHHAPTVWLALAVQLAVPGLRRAEA